MRDINDIKNELYTISDEIQELQNKGYKLQKELMGIQQKKLEVLVGVCVINKSVIYKVYDIPREAKFTINFEFNPYQIPVIKLENDTITKTTLFSRAVDDEKPLDRFLKEHRFCESSKFDERLDLITKKLRDEI